MAPENSSRHCGLWPRRRRSLGEEVQTILYLVALGAQLQARDGLDTASEHRGSKTTRQVSYVVFTLWAILAVTAFTVGVGALVGSLLCAPTARISNILLAARDVEITQPISVLPLNWQQCVGKATPAGFSLHVPSDAISLCQPQVRRVLRDERGTDSTDSRWFDARAAPVAAQRLEFGVSATRAGVSQPYSARKMFGAHATTTSQTESIASNFGNPHRIPSRDASAFPGHSQPRDLISATTLVDIITPTRTPWYLVTSSFSFTVRVQGASLLSNAVDFCSAGGCSLQLVLPKAVGDVLSSHIAPTLPNRDGPPRDASARQLIARADRITRMQNSYTNKIGPFDPEGPGRHNTATAPSNNATFVPPPFGAGELSNSHSGDGTNSNKVHLAAQDNDVRFQEIGTFAARSTVTVRQAEVKRVKFDAEVAFVVAADDVVLATALAPSFLDSVRSQITLQGLRRLCGLSSDNVVSGHNRATTATGLPVIISIKRGRMFSLGTKIQLAPVVFVPLRLPCVL